ncbi:MAG: hypothetical protein OIN84_21480 [Candidatus Methanoperedens sp.]|nr:hypothetical protein [Candidatus Methanoperedens sp.]
MINRLVLATVLVGVSLLTLGIGSGSARQDGGLVLFQNNPILAVGVADDWDSGYVAAGDVLFYDGLYHMFYQGSTKAFIDPISIGHATSPDGYIWTKDEANPVLVPGQADAMNPYASLIVNTVLVEDGVWTMYFTVHPATGTFNSSQVRRAVAESPGGPWVVEPNPVIESGASRRWDTDVVVWPYVVPADQGYHMYYIGCCARGPVGGLALSPDGDTWTKYDDPATDERAFAESDAVLLLGDTGTWDHGFLNAFDAWHDENGWHMLYNAGDQQEFGYGYASSADGITWTKSASNPLRIETVPTQASPAFEGLIAVAPSDMEDTYFVYGDFALDGVASEINLALWTPPVD